MATATLYCGVEVLGGVRPLLWHVAAAGVGGRLCGVEE